MVGWGLEQNCSACLQEGEERGGVGKGGEWKGGDRRETEMQLYRRGKVFPGSSINRRDIAEMSKGDASNGACWFYDEILS